MIFGQFEKWNAMALLAIGLVAGPGDLARGEDNPGPPSTAGSPGLDIDAIVKGMRDTAKRFDPRVSTFEVWSRQECEVFDKEGQSIPGRSYRNEEEYARKLNKAYSHFRVKQVSDSEPNEEWNVWKDRVSTQRSRDGIVIYPNLIHQCFNRCKYLQNLFMDYCQDLEFTSPTDLAEDPNIKRPSDAFFASLPRIVEENRPRYKLRPALEVVDGFPCHVLEWPGIDIIWIDASHGFIARRRQFSISPDYLATIWLNQDLKEFGAGLWLPQTQVEYRYITGDGPPEDGPPKVKTQSVIKLLKADFTPKSDDFFKVPLADDERVIVNDNVREVNYFKHVKGSNPIQNVLRDARIAPQSKAKETLLLINGILIGLITVVVLSYRLHKFRRIT